MADEIDFSQWTGGTTVRGRRSEQVRARNPLVPGGEGERPAHVEVRLDTFIPATETPPDVLARDAREAAERRLAQDAGFYNLLAGIIGPLPEPQPVRAVVDPVDRDITLRVAEILGQSDDPQTRAAGAALRTSTLDNSDLSVAVRPLESGRGDDHG